MKRLLLLLLLATGIAGLTQAQTVIPVVNGTATIDTLTCGANAGGYGCSFKIAMTGTTSLVINNARGGQQLAIIFSDAGNYTLNWPVNVSGPPTVSSTTGLVQLQFDSTQGLWFTVSNSSSVIASGTPGQPAVYTGTNTIGSIGNGVIYYVSNSGSDSNNGTTQTTAWAHSPGMSACTGMCASTVIFPGSSILFQRGGTWAYKITPTASGLQGTPILYSAYGSGARPILTGDGTTGIDASNLSWLTFDNLSINTVVQAFRIYPTSGISRGITIQNSTLGPITGAGSGCVFVQPTLGSGQLTDLTINNNSCTPDPGSPPGTFLDNRFSWVISCLGGGNCTNPTLGPGVLRFAITNNTEAANGAGKHCIQVWHGSQGIISGNTCDKDGQSNIDVKDSDN